MVFNYNNMRALGIDPGYGRLGVAVVEKSNNEEVLLYSGCIETDKNTDIDERLFILGNELRNIFVKYSPDIVGVETVFFNKNVKTAIMVAQARGVVLYIAKNYGCKIYNLGPQEIKVAVTGYGKSDKNSVIDMVKRLILNVPDNALDDEYDAIAAAIAALAHCR